MANDPYAASADFNEHYAESGPPRTSVLAILSLVLSLICFIPGLSAIGSLLGVFALLGISASKGRVKGTGLAISGIAIGIVVSLLWFVAAYAMQKGLSQYTAFGQVITDVDSGSYDAARGLLTKETRVLADDATLETFKNAYEAEAGKLVGWPKGITGVFSSFAELGQSGNQPDASKLPYANAMPLPGKFSNGARLVWVILDQQGQLNDAGTLPAIINVAIESDDGTLIWLVDPDVQRAGASAPTGADTETGAELEPETEATPEPEPEPVDTGEGG